MTDEFAIKLDKDSLTSLLRSNLSCHMGKTITQDLLSELTVQIIESIEYFLNNKIDICL